MARAEWAAKLSLNSFNSIAFLRPETQTISYKPYWITNEFLLLIIE